MLFQDISQQDNLTEVHKHIRSEEGERKKEKCSNPPKQTQNEEFKPFKRESFFHFFYAII